MKTSSLSATIWALAVASLIVGGMCNSALADGATATPTPMMMPKIPLIRLQTLPGYGPAPLTVGFLVSSVDPETVLQTFTWNFGDGQSSMLPPTALFHTYQNPGSYVVSVTATTADGHQASSFAGVVVTTPAH
jgi:PKD repeat protein